MPASFLRTSADVMHDHGASWSFLCCGEGVLALIEESRAIPFRWAGKPSKVST